MSMPCKAHGLHTGTTLSMEHLSTCACVHMYYIVTKSKLAMVNLSCHYTVIALTIIWHCTGFDGCSINIIEKNRMAA